MPRPRDLVGGSLCFSRAELIEVARNGVTSSTLETSQRAKIEAELNALAAALTPSALR